MSLGLTLAQWQVARLQDAIIEAHHAVLRSVNARSRRAQLKNGRQAMAQLQRALNALAAPARIPPTGGARPSIDAMAKYLRRRELPLLGSNQDSPDPEGV